MAFPTSPYEDYQKTGMDKMVRLAKILCGLVITFEPIIRTKFPDSGAIIALLEAIKALCVLLPAAQAEFLAYNMNESTPPADAEDTAGIDGTAPPAQAPDIT